MIYTKSGWRPTPERAMQGDIIVVLSSPLGCHVQTLQRIEVQHLMDMFAKLDDGDFDTGRKFGEAVMMAPGADLKTVVASFYAALLLTERVEAIDSTE